MDQQTSTPDANLSSEEHDIEIRKIKLDEIPAIQYIAKTTWPHTFGKVLPSEQLEYMLELIYSEEVLMRQITKKQHNFLLALKGKDPLGFASFEFNYQSEPQTMIHKLYLLPQCQGKGVGTNLIEFIANAAKDIGNNMLRLKVYIDNPKAIGFYEKTGFCKCGTETTEIGNDYQIEDYIMIKKI